jgi:hypothetical protein
VRRHYLLKVQVNRRSYEEVIIDSHYEEKHRASVNDEMILDLVRALDGLEFPVAGTDEEGFEYFKTDPLFLGEKPYRLIWLTHPKETFIGVRNAFRRNYAKKMAK